MRELIEVDLETNDRNRTSQVAFQLLSLSRSANCVLSDALRIADVSRLSGEGHLQFANWQLLALRQAGITVLNPGIDSWGQEKPGATEKEEFGFILMSGGGGPSPVRAQGLRAAKVGCGFPAFPLHFLWPRKRQYPATEITMLRAHAKRLAASGDRSEVRSIDKVQ